MRLALPQYGRCLLLIAVLSFILRLVSIDHNLPYDIVADEGSDLSSTMRLLSGELLSPDVRFQRGLIAENNIIPVLGVFLINFIDGDTRSVSAFQDLYFSNRAEFTYATRLWVIFESSIAIFLLGLAGAYLHPRVGLAAALILALNSFYFHNSLFALPDALGASVVALAIWLIMRLWYFKRTRDYIFAALALALLILAKIQASALGISFLLAHAYICYEMTKGNWKELLPKFFLNKNLWIAAFAGLLGIILFNPFAFIYPADLLSELGASGNRFSNDSPTLTLVFNILQQDLYSMSILLVRWALPLAVLGCFVIWTKRHSPAHILAFTSFLALILAVSYVRLSPVSKLYYWNPWLIPMALMAGIAVDAAWEWAKSKPMRYILGSIALILILLEGQFLTHIFNLMNRPTTQEMAREFVISEIPSDSRILASDPLIAGVSLYRNERSILRTREITGTMLSYWSWWLEQSPESRPGPAYDIYSYEYSDTINSFEELQEFIEAEQIDYYISVNYCDSASQDPAAASNRAFPPYSEELVANWELMAEFSPYGSEPCIMPINGRTKIALNIGIYQQVYTGPQILIYRIRR